MKSSKIIYAVLLYSLLVFAIADKSLAIEVGDVDRQIQKQKWEEKENKLPDDKRLRVAGFGGAILVEKSTKLTLGVYPVENGKTVPVYPKAAKGVDRLRELRIVLNNITYAYDIGNTASCPDPNFEIVQSTVNYIFWIDRCFSTNRRGEADNTFTHYVFDKKQKKVVMLLSSPRPMNGPKIKYQNGVYKYRWIGRNENEENVNYYYEFEIKPKDGADLTCHKTWNDSCGDLNLVPMLYKK